MNLPAPLLRAVEDLGWETSTPIQALALPHLLDGRDLAGQAQTGTGKTACFLLAAMRRLLETPRPQDGSPRALVVAPTRELAIQIADDAAQLAVHTDLEVALCYGGVDLGKQGDALARGTDIVVGTPGRLLDFYKRGKLKLHRIEVFVLDEADRMFDMGFIKDVTYLFRIVPPRGKRQALLFSATLSQDVMRLAWRFMSEPVEVAVEPETIVLDSIDQRLYHVSSREKLSVLLGLLEKEKPRRAMVFVNTKRWGEELTWRLNKNGHHAVYISGDIPQKKRQRIIAALKAGEIDLLVATDVASRGLHVEDVTHVFNYDVPGDPEDYVHRIGRTARAGAAGVAITLACEDFVMGLGAVEKYIGHKIPSFPVTDDLVVHDGSGRFARNRERAYVGWPFDEQHDERAGEAGGDGGGRRREGRGRGRGDAGPKERGRGERTEPAPAPARDAAAPSEDGLGRKRRRRRGSPAAAPIETQAAASEAPAPPPEAPAADAAARTGGRRRERRRLSTGGGATGPETREGS